MADSTTALAAVEASRLNLERSTERHHQLKRKRGEVENGSRDEDCISITIPLFYLDTSSSCDGSETSIFRGTIAELREDKGTTGRDAPVLVAEDTASGRLFVIERIRQDIFVLCKLRQWVSLEDVIRGCFKKRRMEEPSVESQDGALPWWESAQPSAPTKRVDALQPLLKGLRKRFSMRPAPLPEQPLENRRNGPIVSAGALDADKSCQQTSEDLLNGIRAHYLDSLYISRTPLAYFVKGPLSRARAAIQSKDASTLAHSELVEYLRLCIMNLGTGTKKYDNALAELIRELPPGASLEDEESQLTTPVKDKIRKSLKRKKMNKFGLVPGEEEYLLRWWLKREESLEYAGVGDTRESRIKSGLSEQRARETQLQIILILETLALEAAAPKEQSGTTDAAEGNNAEDQPKKKKPLDLMDVLDVLIDRLCIWESMNLDGGKQSKSSASGGNGASHKKLDTEQLRDFCTDVVVPYYATRLPELYTSICQKLGGPSLTSSPPALRTPAPKKAAPKRAAKKGTVSTRRPLVRSATDSALPPTLKRELSVSLADIPTHRPTLAQTGRYAQREVDLEAVTKASEARAARKAAAAAELQNAISTLRRPNAREAVRDLVDSADRRHSQGKSRKAKNPMRNPFAAGGTIGGVQVAATPKAGRVHGRPQYTLPPLPPTLGTAFDSPAADEPELPPPRFSYGAGDLVPSSSLKPRTHAFPDLVDTPLRPLRGAADASSAKIVDSDVEATPSRRARLVPARRPTNPIDLGPEVVFTGDSARSLGALLGGGRATERVARSPLLQRSYTMPLASLGRAGDAALLRTPRKARQVSFAEARDDLVADTPAKAPAVTRRDVEDAVAQSTKEAEVEQAQPVDGAGLAGCGDSGKDVDTADKDEEQDIYAALGWNDEYDL